MNKFLKIILGVLGVIVVGMGIIVVAFMVEMKPDKDKEELVKVQAEQYLADHFNDNFEIYDIMYDNMGNYGFEYAAMVRDQQSDTEFLVYYDEASTQMTDTYIADKWENDIKEEIHPLINDYFAEASEFFVFFTNVHIGQELGIDVLHPQSYKEFDVRPIISITIPRKRSSEDEKIVDELIAALQNEDKLQHGSVVMEYIDEKGVILDEEWRKGF